MNLGNADARFVRPKAQSAEDFINRPHTEPPEHDPRPTPAAFGRLQHLRYIGAGAMVGALLISDNSPPNMTAPAPM